VIHLQVCWRQEQCVVHAFAEVDYLCVERSLHIRMELMLPAYIFFWARAGKVVFLAYPSVDLLADTEACAHSYRRVQSNQCSDQVQQKTGMT
jgi:hypothetical protein